MCVFHFSDSLHTTDVPPLKNACVCFISQTVYTLQMFHLSKMHVYVSFLRQFTHYRYSTPQKCMCMFHFSDSLHTTNVRTLKNACVCFISQTVYTLQIFDPSKMHVYVSFLRQFTHYRCSTPQKCMRMFHFSDSLHTTDVPPLKNACVCFISQTVYTLQMFHPSKIACVCFARCPGVLDGTRRIRSCSKTYRSCQGSFQLISM